MIIIIKKMSVFQNWEPQVIGNKKNKSNNQSKPKPKIINPEDPEDDTPPKSQKFPFELIKNLQTARKNKNLTQKDLATQMMIPISNIQNLENNQIDYNDNNKRFYTTIMRKLGVSIKIADLP